MKAIQQKALNEQTFVLVERGEEHINSILKQTK